MLGFIGWYSIVPDLHLIISPASHALTTMSHTQTALHHRAQSPNTGPHAPPQHCGECEYVTPLQGLSSWVGPRS